MKSPKSIKPARYKGTANIDKAKSNSVLSLKGKGIKAIQLAIADIEIKHPTGIKAKLNFLETFSAPSLKINNNRGFAINDKAEVDARQIKKAEYRVKSPFLIMSNKPKDSGIIIKKHTI